MRITLIARMSEFIVKHKLRPFINRTFAFDERDAALKLMQSGNFVGKIVIAL